VVSAYPTKTEAALNFPFGLVGRPFEVGDGNIPKRKGELTRFNVRYTYLLGRDE
jgi:hypothetical protein